MIYWDIIEYVHIYIYIYAEGRYQVPILPRFLECSVSATSCSILHVHIPVMVLLEIHKDIYIILYIYI